MAACLTRDLLHACVCVHVLHHTEIFQCFLSAREVARSRDRERASSSAGLGSGSVSRSGGAGGGEDDGVLSQEGRRGSTGLPEGQDLYTAACNSVIHRCALLVLGVSPVLGELTKQNQDEGQAQSAAGAQECLSFMTRSEHRDTGTQGRETVVILFSTNTTNSSDRHKPSVSVPVNLLNVLLIPTV